MRDLLTISSSTTDLGGTKFMKKRTIRRLIAILLLLLTVGFASVACKSKNSGDRGSNSTETNTDSGIETVDSQGDTRLLLSDGYRANYTVVLPKNSADELYTAVNSLLDALNNATGVVFRMTADYGEGDPADGGLEILIGKCSRSASKTVLEDLRYKDYNICVQNENIVVAAHDDETAVKGVKKLIRMLDGNIEKIGRRAELNWESNYLYQSLSYKLPDITLNGISVKDYKIVYSADDSVGEENAELLQNSIGSLTGYVLETGSDKTAEQSCEILVGQTNRCKAVYDSLALNLLEYALTTDESKIIIAGAYPYSTQKAIEAFASYALNTKNGIIDEMYQKVSLLSESDFSECDGDIRLMEYNILVEFSGWGSGGTIPSQVEIRKEIVAGIVNGYKPDVICLCEFFDNWRKQLPSLLDDCYEYVAIDRTDGVSNRTTLVYNSDRLRLIDGGYTDIASKDEDTTNRRIVMWGVFEVKETGKRFTVLGTHYASETDEQGDTWRLNQVNKTLELLETLKQKYDVPTILMGDLNCKSGSTPYDTLLEKSGFSDVLDASAGSYVDHILYDTEELAVKKVIRETEKMTSVASDHKPIVADFSFRNIS